MDPWNELLSSKSYCSTVQSPIFSGISPVSRFPDRYRLLRFLKLPTSDGRGPDNELCDKSKYIERTGSLKSSLGIEPFRWFLDKSRSVRLFAIELGICPVNAILECITSCSSWLQFDNEVMNCHPSLSFACSMLLCKYRVWRARNIPSGGGTYPLSLFCSRKSILRVVRLESEAGMDPVNWFVAKLRSFMLGNLLPISALQQECSHGWCYVILDGFACQLADHGCQRPQLTCKDINLISTQHSLFLSLFSSLT